MDTVKPSHPDPKTVVIIDYHMGNLQSVANAVDQLGHQAVISSDPDTIARADRLILPGVGAFGEGIKQLREMNLIPVLTEFVIKRKVPFLGICLGMQLLADVSFEFGTHQGLGWIPGKVDRLKAEGLRLPHIGWNNIRAFRPDSIGSRLPENADFYFVHSYHFICAHDGDVIARCRYGEDFSAVVGRGHIYGVQFHPEKSQKAGKVLLENFMSLVP